MESSRQIRNLALIGFMGTGKSSVGRLAADALHFTFLDTDEVIQARTGKSIAELFSQEGEAAFRVLEQRLVVELEDRDRTVMAAGGGLAVNDANLESLRTHSLVVCLWASPEKIWSRVSSHSHRPLLQGPDPQGQIRKLLDQRAPSYRKADVLVNTDFRSLREVAHQVIHNFKSAQATHKSLR